MLGFPITIEEARRRPRGGPACSSSLLADPAPRRRTLLTSSSPCSPYQCLENFLSPGRFQLGPCILALRKDLVGLVQQDSAGEGPGRTSELAGLEPGASGSGWGGGPVPGLGDPAEPRASARSPGCVGRPSELAASLCPPRGPICRICRYIPVLRVLDGFMAVASPSVPAGGRPDTCRRSRGREKGPGDP